MTNPPPSIESFSQRFPDAWTSASAFAEVNRPQREADIGDDDVTYGDVHRQLMLILNFLASIIGVAATLWIVARWWSTPARLFLTMGGTVVVAIAEVGLYGGYLWHLTEAKKKDKAFKEVKEVIETWVVGGDDDRDDGRDNGGDDGGDKTSDEEAISTDRKALSEKGSLRRRRIGPS
jgi:hypothetical protein